MNWFFLFKMKMDHRGLALGTSIVAIINFLILYMMMRRYAGRLETGTLIRTLAKLVVAGTLLAGVCWVANRLFFNEGLRMSEWKKIGEVTLTIAAGTLVFFTAGFALRIGEVHDVVELVKRRLTR